MQNPLISNAGPKPASRFKRNPNELIEEYESELQLNLENDNNDNQREVKLNGVSNQYWNPIKDKRGPYDGAKDLKA